MALSKTVLTPIGFEAHDAYHRVEGVSLDSKSKMSFSVRSYKDNSGVPAFSESRYYCDYDLNTTNPIAQAYAYLKTQDEFKDAVDC